MEFACQVTGSGARDGRAQWRQCGVREGKVGHGLRHENQEGAPGTCACAEESGSSAVRSYQGRRAQATVSQDEPERPERRKCLSISQASSFLGNKKLRDARVRGSCECAKIRIRNSRDLSSRMCLYATRSRDAYINRSTSSCSRSQGATAASNPLADRQRRVLRV